MLSFGKEKMQQMSLHDSESISRHYQERFTIWQKYGKKAALPHK